MSKSASWLKRTLGVLVKASAGPRPPLPTRSSAPRAKAFLATGSEEDSLYFIGKPLWSQGRSREPGNERQQSLLPGWQHTYQEEVSLLSGNCSISGWMGFLNLPEGLRPLHLIPNLWARLRLDQPPRRALCVCV